MVEWDCADIVVKNMSLDDTVKKLSTNEPKLSIDGCSGSSSVRPAFATVVRKRWVSVLEKGDGD